MEKEIGPGRYATKLCKIILVGFSLISCSNIWGLRIGRFRRYATNFLNLYLKIELGEFGDWQILQICNKTLPSNLIS